MLNLNDLFSVLMYPIIRVQLLLQLYYRLIPLIQPRCQRYHYVPLLKQQLLVPVNLCLLLLDLVPLLLHLLQLLLILLPNQLLLLLQHYPKLWRLLDLLPPDQHLRIKRPYLLLEPLLLVPLHYVLPVPLLERVDRRGLVLLRPPLLLLQLQQVRVRVYVPVLLVELELQLPQLHLVLPEQRPLVHVLVDARLVLDLLGTRRELQRRDGLAEAL